MPFRNKRAHHSPIDEAYWDKLDNAAKLFPAVTTTRSPNVFRLSAVLYEDVNPEKLQSAVEKAIDIMPSFAVKLNRGLFWYYFDVNTERPKVKKESKFPCSPIYKSGEKGFLFRVTYYNKRINFELYHALSDGMGAVTFFKLIVYCYLNGTHPDVISEHFITREGINAATDFDEDSFARNVIESTPAKPPEKDNNTAYHISGYKYDGTRLGVLSAIMSCDSLSNLAKKEGVTLSEYVCALLIYSVYNTTYKRGRRNLPIVISIPVNLRGMFDSNTLRNFFGHMNVSFMPTKNVSFEDVLLSVKNSFCENLKRENFEKQISDRVKIEAIPGVKFVPIGIKNIVLRHYYRNTEKLYTMTFSNLGRITFDNGADKFIERVEVINGGSETHVKKAALCSYNNKLVLTFTSTIDDNSFERFLLCFLVEQGIDISICSNETDPPKKEKRQGKALKSDNKVKKKKAPKHKENNKSEG